MILIRDDESKCTLAFLVDYDLERNLAEVRTQILEQLSGLVREDFTFTLFGCPIAQLQESNYLLKHCISLTEVDGFKYEICIKGKLQDTEMKCDFLTEQPEIPTINSTEFCSKDKVEISKIVSAAKNDKNEGDDIVSKTTKDCKTVIKRYTDNELLVEDSSLLFEKERKVFWNKKAQEIENDEALRDWGTQALHGVIDVAWTMKKTELLILNVKKYETLNIQNLRENAAVGKSMMENLERVEKAHAAVNHTYKFLCEDVVANRISQEYLEEKLDKKISELKKAQADLVKSCKNFTSKRGEGGSATNENYFPPLKEAEMEELVEDVCIVDYESE